MKSWVRALSVTGAMTASGVLGGCGSSNGSNNQHFDFAIESPLEQLLQDGESNAITPITTVADLTQPTRTCTDCTLEPLAYWTFNYCSPTSTELGDENATSG